MPACRRALATLAAGAALLAGFAAARQAAGEETSTQPVAAPGILYEQRVAYRRAIHALRNGRSGEYRREAAKLDDYVLAPYLRYFEAQGRISSIRPGQARQVREALADTPLAERFFRQWLNTQARRGRWNVYLEHYEPTQDAAGRCNYLRSLYRSGERGEALAQVRELWIAPKSQPKTCDPLFSAWMGAGLLDQAAVWERLSLALDARQTSLARYLLRFFEGREAAAGRLYLDAHLRPRLVRSLSRFPNTESGRRALANGLLRHARDEAEEALALWGRARGSHDFDAGVAKYLHEQLTARAAAEGRVPSYDPATFSPEAVEQVAGALVEQQQWQRAAAWIDALPQDVAAKPRWRYWLGRSLIDGSVDTQRGQEALRAVAGVRTYYGFLAAEDLGLEPALNADTRHSSDADVQALREESAAVARMAELYIAEDLVNARREWRFALGSLSGEQRRRLVELTMQLGWVDQSIFGARDAELPDMVAARFPTPFEDVFARSASDTDLRPALLFAISRQESAFNPRAVSSAGARGLMQLMPATAREAADRLRIARPASRDLFDPSVNVRLGAHHLARLMVRYEGNRALAAAAYNAGEHRVRRWRKDASGMPTTVWVERIPFRETRDYVKAVLAFDQVYSRLRGESAPVLWAHERFIP